MAHIDCCTDENGTFYEKDIKCEKCGDYFCKVCIDDPIEHICEKKILNVDVVFDNNKKHFKIKVKTNDNFNVFIGELKDVKIITNALTKMSFNK
jgi:hypothetical protein